MTRSENILDFFYRFQKLQEFSDFFRTKKKNLRQTKKSSDRVFRVFIPASMGLSVEIGVSNLVTFHSHSHELRNETSSLSLSLSYMHAHTRTHALFHAMKEPTKKNYFDNLEGITLREISPAVGEEE